MTEVIVTIRLSPSLLAEVSKVSKEEHYLDQSEFVRSVLRKKFEESSRGNSRALADAIIADIKKHSVMTTEARLSEELKGIRDRLKDEMK